MATRFAELGARLVLTSRSLAHLEPTAEELRKKIKGAEIHAVACDIRQPAEVDAMVASAVAKFGRVDVLLNNAAGNFLAQTEKLSPNAFSSVVNIVLNGSFNCTLACGKQMIAQGTGGQIVSIVTTYAWTGSAYVVPSACAKAGVLAMTRSLAVEWARHKIRCNAIAPGPFPTEGAWARLVPPGMDDAAGGMVKQIPAGRSRRARRAQQPGGLPARRRVGVHHRRVRGDRRRRVADGRRVQRLHRLRPDRARADVRYDAAEEVAGRRASRLTDQLSPRRRRSARTRTCAADRQAASIACRSSR